MTDRRVVSDETMTAAIKSAHNYHAWVFGSFARYLVGGTVLEVGSGHGRYARHIAPLVDKLLISDIDPAAVDAIRRDLTDLGDRVECLVMDGVDPARLPGLLDAVVLVNLLEHVEDDAALLRHCREAVRPGGRVILFVPAFEVLFSRMDADAGHFRRYRRGTLLPLVRGAGLRVIESRYFNSVGFFGWGANKLLGSHVNSGATNAQVAVYDRLIPLLRHADRVLPFLGQSLVVIAER
ncbi:MAG: hypothetical protein AMXMBFR64_18480 [Myxococcales bacterium]